MKYLYVVVAVGVESRLPAHVYFFSHPTYLDMVSGVETKMSSFPELGLVRNVLCLRAGGLEQCFFAIKAL